MAGLIAWLVSALGGLALRLTVPLMFAALGALGLGIVTYTGIDLLLQEATDQIVGSMQGLPANMAAMAGILKHDVALNIMISAFVARLTLTGLSAGAKSVFRIINPSG